MNIKERSFNIVAGPSRDAIFDCCKYTTGLRSCVRVKFDVVVGYTMPPEHPGCAEIRDEVKDAVIYSIQHEDGSGESFNIEGHATYNHERVKFSAYYNTKRRSGMMKLIK